MSEFFKIFLTSALTIVGGIIILVFGQIVTKFFIDPLHEQKKTIGEIADALIYYANIYSNPGFSSDERMNEASQRLRQLAGLLESKTHLIPLYGVLAKGRIVIKTENIQEASSQLIGLSNSIFGRGGKGQQAEFNETKSNKIKEMLDLKIKL